MIAKSILAVLAAASAAALCSDFNNCEPLGKALKGLVNEGKVRRSALDAVTDFGGIDPTILSVEEQNEIARRAQADDAARREDDFISMDLSENEIESFEFNRRE